MRESESPHKINTICPSKISESVTAKLADSLHGKLPLNKYVCMHMEMCISHVYCLCSNLAFYCSFVSTVKYLLVTY